MIAAFSPHCLILSCSGYDFGYMVKLLTDSRLPEEEHEFFHILNLFFPSIYDVKYLMKSCKNLKVHNIFLNISNNKKDKTDLSFCFITIFRN